LTVRLQEHPSRFSVLVPATDAGHVVIASVQALEKPEFDITFDVIVIMDSSQNGSADAAPQSQDAAATGEMAVSRRRHGGAPFVMLLMHP
jgi:hypothetical protein